MSDEDHWARAARPRTIKINRHVEVTPYAGPPFTINPHVVRTVRTGPIEIVRKVEEPRTIAVNIKQVKQEPQTLAVDVKPTKPRRAPQHDRHCVDRQVKIMGERIDAAVLRKLTPAKAANALLDCCSNDPLAGAFHALLSAAGDRGRVDLAGVVSVLLGYDEQTVLHLARKWRR